MQNNRKKKILAIVLIAVVLLLGVAAVLVTIQLQKAPVPTAPPSKPQAAEWLGGTNCNVGFVVAPPPTLPAPAVPVCTTKQAFNADNVELVANAGVSVGQTFTYQVNYKNNATTTATGIVIEDSLPKEVTLKGNTCASIVTEARIGGGTAIRCNVADLAAGGTAGVRFTVQVAADAPAGASFTNTSWVSGPNSGPTSTTCNLDLKVLTPGVLACTQKTVYNDVAGNAAGSYQLTAANLVSSETGTKLFPGQRYVYAIGYNNSGGTAVSTGRVTDVLSDKLTFVDATTGCTYSSANRTVACDLATVAAGGTGQVGIRVKVNETATGDVANAATIVGSNTCSITYPLATASIACVSKEAYKNESDNTAGSYAYRQIISTAAQSETFTYDIKAKNSGDATASAITITDALTGENQGSLTFVDANQGCTYNSTSRVVTCQSTNIPPGTEVAYGFRVKVPASAANGQVIKNQATVDYAGATSNCTKDVTVSGVVSCNNTCTTDAECSNGLVCSGGKCRNSTCAGEESCVCPTPTPTGVTPAACRGGCSTDSDCAAGLTCNNGVCRNSTCPATDNESCRCPVAVVTRVVTTAATKAPTAAPTQAPAQLPSTGIFNLPGAAAFGGGLLLTILGILFAL